MEKYGFIYIWRDKKRNKFYIGCHWGTEGDGYICSSTVMRKAYRRRPNDFKRRIIQRVYTDRLNLLEVEHRWLALIPDDQLGRRYYNLTKRHFGHWSATDRAADIGRKISASAMRNERISLAHKGKKLTPEHREKLSAAKRGKKASEETKLKMSMSQKGRVVSDETRQKMAESQRGRTLSTEHRAKLSAWQKGLKRGPPSEETRRKISEAKRKPRT